MADTTPVNDGQWHHVAVVITLGQNVRFYIDGNLRSAQPIVTLASTNATPLWLGTVPFNPYFNLGLPFTGSLDNVQIFNQALSASAVAVLAAGSQTPLRRRASLFGNASERQPQRRPDTAVYGCGFGQRQHGGYVVSERLRRVDLRDGLYTAPASIATQQNVTVTATSQAEAPSPPASRYAYASGSTVGSSAPVASWSFDNANISGTLVIDTSGNGLNGILSGTDPSRERSIRP